MGLVLNSFKQRIFIHSWSYVSIHRSCASSPFLSVSIHQPCLHPSVMSPSIGHVSPSICPYYCYYTFCEAHCLRQLTTIRNNSDAITARVSCRHYSAVMSHNSSCPRYTLQITYTKQQGACLCREVGSSDALQTEDITSKEKELR